MSAANLWRDWPLLFVHLAWFLFGWARMRASGLIASVSFFRSTCRSLLRNFSVFFPLFLAHHDAILARAWRSGQRYTVLKQGFKTPVRSRWPTLCQPASVRRAIRRAPTGRDGACKGVKQLRSLELPDLDQPGAEERPLDQRDGFGQFWVRRGSYEDKLALDVA